jgi:hypothetical protein
MMIFNTRRAAARLGPYMIEYMPSLMLPPSYSSNIILPPPWVELSEACLLGGYFHFLDTKNQNLPHLHFANGFANQLFPYKTIIRFFSFKIPVYTRHLMDNKYTK